ncbi:hypothetical protein BG004_001000 [Podila humilis]|nr:hypothetical protein BG004_001000 [Podila humilis]
MFKKKAHRASVVTPIHPKNIEDDDGVSPTITVTIPQDALYLPDPPVNMSSSASSSRRSSLDSKQHVNQSQMAWKPWNPQKIGGLGTTNIMPDQPHLHKVPSSLPGTPAALTTATATGSSTSASGNMAGEGEKGLKSPGMLNLGGIFSSSTATSVATTNITAGSASTNGPQHIEARLWNADLADLSPLSPAGPRYIPAVAGAGAAAGSRRMNFGGSRRSLEVQSSHNGGFRSFGQAAATSATDGQERKTPKSPHQTQGQASLPKEASASSITSPRSAADRKFSKSTVAATGYLSGTVSPPIAQKGDPSKFVNEKRRWDGQKWARNESHNVRQVKEESSWRKSTRRTLDDSDSEMLNTFDSSEGSTSPFYGREGLDGLGTDYDDDDNRKRDRRSFTRTEAGMIGRLKTVFYYPQRLLRARMISLRFHRRRIHPCVRLSILLLLAGCVCFTTIELLFNYGDSTKSRSSIQRAIGDRAKDMQLGGLLRAPTKRTMSAFDVEAQNYSLHQWELGTLNIHGSKMVAKVAEDYMLSKAFSGAMHPSRVIPFYFKASFKDENDDDDFHADDEIEGEHGDYNSGTIDLDRSQVTITTLITPDRYGVFLKLVKQYRGPISVATHIPKGDDQDRHFQELHEFFHDHTILRKYVDLHVIVDGIDLQLNMWRNVARMFARTDYFMMLDVDFHIPSGLKQHLHDDPRMQELLASGAALVIPAFEYKADKDPKDSKYFPDTKAALIPLLEKGHIHVFHDSFPPGHAATDTPRWMKMKHNANMEEGHAGDHDREELSMEDYLEMEAEGEKPYKVTAFEPKYEPYIVLKKEGTPWCDERFVGYGANKAACLFEIYISGVDFWVMPNDFLIHQYHNYPTQNRKNGRILNKQLFVSFRQEICYLTLTRMIGTGEWYTSKADNLRHQCQVFDGFLKSADQMAHDFEKRYPDSLSKEPVFVAHGQRRPRIHMSDLSTSAPQIVMVEREPHGTIGNRESLHGTRDKVLDPSMSRPHGQIWGGIQVRTFYVPPPEEEDERVFDSLVGKGDSGESQDSGGDQQANGHQHEPIQQQQHPDLTGTKLEQFREGIIDSEEDDPSKFAFPKEGEREYQEQEQDRVRRLQEEWLHRDPSSPGSTDDTVRRVGSGTENTRQGDGELDDRFRRDPNESFEDAAHRLEDRFRQLGLNL